MAIILAIIGLFFSTLAVLFVFMLIGQAIDVLLDRRQPSGRSD